MTINSILAAAIKARMDEPDMAIGDAIDALAAEFSAEPIPDRKRLLTVIPSLSRAELHDLFMVGWAKAPLKLATGKTRDQWLSLFDRM